MMFSTRLEYILFDWVIKYGSSVTSTLCFKIIQNRGYIWQIMHHNRIQMNDEVLLDIRAPQHNKECLLDLAKLEDSSEQKRISVTSSELRLNEEVVIPHKSPNSRWVPLPRSTWWWYYPSTVTRESSWTESGRTPPLQTVLFYKQPSQIPSAHLPFSLCQHLSTGSVDWPNWLGTFSSQSVITLILPDTSSIKSC